MHSSSSFALITGASSGLGWHFSMELAARGYDVLAVSNQPEKLRLLRTEIESRYTVSVLIMDLDLAKQDAAELLYMFCVKQKLQVEFLVNNAGLLLYGEISSITFASVQDLLQLHMNTPTLLCHLFGTQMKLRSRGHIINVSSISALMPYPTISIYGPTKSYLRQFTRALRTEWSPFGVKVSCLIPGATETPLYEQYDIDFSKARKLGIMMQPNVVVRAGIRAAFKNKAECIPGLLNKILVRLLPLVPNALIGYVFRRRINS